MKNQETNFIILSIVILFGWMLSFPFYGPVLYSVAPQEYSAITLAIIFSLFHFLGLLIGGVVLKNTGLWLKLMKYSVIIILFTNIMLMLPLSWVWPFSMGIIGVCSALYILGWSCIYSLSLPIDGRLKVMVKVIIGANLIFIIYNLLTNIMSPGLLLPSILLPILLVTVMLFKFPIDYLENVSMPKRNVLVPKKLLLVLCFVVLSLFFNGGLMYSIIMPALDEGNSLYQYYKFFPYIIVLLAMYRYGEKFRWHFSLYMGISLLGLSFVSFALVRNIKVGYMLTGWLIEASFAFLDLFVWSILGILAFIYRKPYLFFGLVMATTTASIVIGNIAGYRFLIILEHQRLVTALLAASSIFVVYLFIPWLNEQLEKNLSRLPKSEGTLKVNDDYKVYLLPGEKLTPREIEITQLIFEGLTNKDIADKLFISINTLKTHLKNIYSKFGVRQKRELLSMKAKQDNQNRQM